jgi:hypothetical protein
MAEPAPGKAAALLFDQGIYEGQYLKDWLGERLGELGSWS